MYHGISVHKSKSINGGEHNRQSFAFVCVICGYGERVADYLRNVLDVAQLKRGHRVIGGRLESDDKVFVYRKRVAVFNFCTVYLDYAVIRVSHIAHGKGFINLNYGRNAIPFVSVSNRVISARLGNESVRLGKSRFRDYFIIAFGNLDRSFEFLVRA